MTLVEVYISCIIINKVRNIFELVGTVLNLGEKMKIYPQVLMFFLKPPIWLFHFVVLQTTAKK